MNTNDILHNAKKMSSKLIDFTIDQNALIKAEEWMIKASMDKFVWVFIHPTARLGLMVVGGLCSTINMDAYEKHFANANKGDMFHDTTSYKNFLSLWNHPEGQNSDIEICEAICEFLSICKDFKGVYAPDIHPYEVVKILTPLVMELCCDVEFRKKHLKNRLALIRKGALKPQDNLVVICRCII